MRNLLIIVGSLILLLTVVLLRKAYIDNPPMSAVTLCEVPHTSGKLGARISVEKKPAFFGGSDYSTWICAWKVTPTGVHHLFVYEEVPSSWTSGMPEQTIYEIKETHDAKRKLPTCGITWGKTDIIFNLNRVKVVRPWP